MIYIAFFSVALSFPIAGANEIAPDNGSCLGNQCFAAFSEPTDFETADIFCRKKLGHLMTVGSSVSHNILAVLLAKRSERYWIGLHLPSGCSDDAKKLRGFQWVTGGTKSEHSNWDSYHPGCSNQCVSVSADDGFKWLAGSCDTKAGFLCEYSFETPCKPLAGLHGKFVRYKLPYGFEGEDVPLLPQGSVATHSDSGSKYTCSSEQWLKAPWNCEIDKGGCEHMCIKDKDGTEICFCPPGQGVSRENNITCEVIKDDPCVALGCKQVCGLRNNSYACMCKQGFELMEDGKSCKDIDNCLDERQCPLDAHACVNTKGGFKCECKPGYRTTRDNDCVDIDECVSARCEHECANTLGSYKCSCYDGFRADPVNPEKCKLHCNKKECPAVCDPNVASQCECADGFVLHERDNMDMVCVDIDECMMGYCDQQCSNSYGGYTCFCSPGFILVDIYKCVVDTTIDDWEGSGSTVPYMFTTPGNEPLDPGPPRLSAGGLLAVIVSVAVVVFVAVFVAHHFYNQRHELQGTSALKTDEAHALHLVTTEPDDEKPAKMMEE